MDNQNIKAFITVAHCGSFSEAAEQLYLTQSAISKRIAQLEHQVGKKLFDRFARQVSLTEAGTELLPRVKRILQEYENALQAISDLSGEASGTLRLAISHHLGLHRLPPILKQFAQQYPNVTLDIEFMDSEKAYERVLQGQSEVAVITLALEPQHNIDSQVVWTGPAAVYLRPGSPPSQHQTADAGESGGVLDYFAGHQYLHRADYSEAISEGRDTVKGAYVDQLFGDHKHYG